MQVYLVGGAVRDELLGRSVKERDWVVVGATPAELAALGYRPAGRDFPVFLHPKTHEEYALARLERKVGPGYRGFTTEFSPAVTLEEDLRRRDLTINAMARAADGTIIDPYGGQDDLRKRALRHVSEAFSEDPVRILRVARFAARFAPLGFTIAPETGALMRHMVEAGEVAALVSERVWRELERALGEAQPTRFFEVLADCGALAVVMPELAPRPDAAALAALAGAAKASAGTPVRWAALLAGLDAAPIGALCDRLRAPNEYRELALLTARLQAHLRSSARPFQQLIGEPGEVMTLLELADAFRRPERFALWLEVMELRAAAAGAPAADTVAAAQRLRSALAAAGAVKLPESELRALQGPAIAAHLRTLRLAALAALH